MDVEPSRAREDPATDCRIGALTHLLADLCVVVLGSLLMLLPAYFALDRVEVATAHGWASAGDTLWLAPIAGYLTTFLVYRDLLALRLPWSVRSVPEDVYDTLMYRIAIGGILTALFVLGLVLALPHDIDPDPAGFDSRLGSADLSAIGLFLGLTAFTTLVAGGNRARRNRAFAYAQWKDRFALRTDRRPAHPRRAVALVGTVGIAMAAMLGFAAWSDWSATPGRTTLLPVRWRSGCATGCNPLHAIAQARSLGDAAVDAVRVTGSMLGLILMIWLLYAVWPRTRWARESMS